jgi:hypothetical protein
MNANGLFRRRSKQETTYAAIELNNRQFDFADRWLGVGSGDLGMR